MKKIIGLFFVLFAINLVSSQVRADIYNFSDEGYRLRYLELTKQLRCPKCQNQDIADSHAPIAADMRKAVYRLLEEGKSNEQIVKFMTDRFGEFVAYKPKVIPSTYLLWYGPWVFICVGIIVILLIVRMRKNGKPADEDVKDIETSQKKQIETLLSRYSKSNKDDV